MARRNRRPVEPKNWRLRLALVGQRIERRRLDRALTAEEWAQLEEVTFQRDRLAWRWIAVKWGLYRVAVSGGRLVTEKRASL